jgi:hypothetical protein
LPEADAATEGDFMIAEGLMLVSVFVLCGAGALLGILVPDRRSPAVLAWVGSLTSLLT